MTGSCSGDPVVAQSVPPPCHTAARKYRGPISGEVSTGSPRSVRILASGVDSLYLSACGQVWNPSTWDLEDEQKEAARRREPVPVEFPDCGGTMLMLPRGRRQFDMWLTSPTFDVGIGSDDGQPDAYLELHSAFIHTVGVEAALAVAQQFLRRHVFCGPYETVVSRIDLHADEQGWGPDAADLHRFVTRAQSRRAFDQVHVHGRRLSGFVFGRRHIVGRIYDKTLEMTMKGQTWPELLWHDRDPEASVWRVEFQFRRQALRRCGIQTPEDALAHRQELWARGIEWLSLRVPDAGDTNSSRWAVAHEWIDLSRAAMGSPRSDLVPQRIHRDDERRLVQGLVGYASSLTAAGSAHGLDRAILRTVPGVEAYLLARGLDFTELVDRKLAKRAALPVAASPR